MKVKSESEVTQSCPTLSDPMDYSLPGSSIHGIFQARVLEWGAIAFSIRDPRLNLFCPSITIGRKRSYSSVHREGRNCFSFSYYIERISVHINKKDLNIT